MSEVTIIPARPPAIPSKRSAPITRVAAYVRVSTSSDPQEESFESQISHFEDYINSHPGWELVEIFKDEGITGLNTNHRNGFKSLMYAAKTHRVDHIIVISLLGGVAYRNRSVVR